MAAALPILEVAAARDVLWERCRNSLGNARLLVQEGRPEALVATACHLAVECAVRTALEQAGLGFDGDLRRGLDRLEAPHGLWDPDGKRRGPALLAAAEKAVGWVAAWLRVQAPQRSWGY